MSTVRTQGNEILVDPPKEESQSYSSLSADIALAGWVMGKVDAWEDHRNTAYAKRWKEYWRMWRGLWHSDDKNRASERSRLIAPALSQAIEASAAEVETALLDKSNWIDIADNYGDQAPQDVMVARDNLLCDLDAVNAKEVVKEAILNAAIFGTGIIKLNVQISDVDKVVRGPDKRLKREQKEKVLVVPECVRPDEFIPDPAAKTLEEGMGCAVKLVKPQHYVLEKIKTGEYRREALALLAPSQKSRSGHEVDFGVDASATLVVADAEPIEITEYQGKVPAGLLDKIVNGSSELPADAILGIGDPSDETLVEAIVTIANGGVVLRAMVNPFVYGDRGFLVTPWEQVPGRFWGRGVGEKGWNPQKGLDAELRSRQDSLGYISAPMIGVDAGRLPKGFRMEVKPGKVWTTNGPPREIIQPLEMGALQQATFAQTQEMERMVQMGTGAFDTAAALNSQSQSGANSAGSNSAMMGAFVKRAKRAASTIERNLIVPLVRKSLWRYMQFDPERYPTDFEFKVNGSMGIMAREVESMQLTQLLGMLPQEVAPAVALATAKGIVDLSSVSNKAEINAAIDKALQPPPPEVQRKQQELEELQFVAQKAQAEALLLENQKTLAETRKILNEALVAARRASLEERKQDGEEARILLQLKDLEEQQRANQLDNKRLELEERRVVIDEKEASKPKPA